MRRTALAVAAIGFLTACTPPGKRTALECVAPANPGGGWDLTCRATAQILHEQALIPRPMRVTNLPGAGGGIAYANAVARRAGDAGVIVAASPATTLRLAQGQYGDLTHEDVRWLAALGADYGVIAVPYDAQWSTLETLLDAWRRDPGHLVVGGGSAVGGQDHMKVLVLARAAGIEPRQIRYVPFDGGGEAITTMLGGFIHIFSGDATEVRAQLEARNVRVLAVLAPERVDGMLADVPTARELGYDVDWVTWRGFYAPPGASEQEYDEWIAALRTLEQSDAWATARTRTGLAPFYRGGQEFERLVSAQVETFRVLSAELGLRN